ncbi:hypothetical protein A3D05_04375 [Candidatus Gottesmanbacteria bacterium RIFCSPHIGHO2_02_FULL_40_24]|nr:MAG: hypothetical protein A3D05_04375 [Candidatus Gottesmanbacteria bacterium RIFCSPHIGHO2_02_FULL_40_24]
MSLQSPDIKANTPPPPPEGSKITFTGVDFSNFGRDLRNNLPKMANPETASWVSGQFDEKFRPILTVIMSTAKKVYGEFTESGMASQDLLFKAIKVITGIGPSEKKLQKLLLDRYTGINPNPDPLSPGVTIELEEKTLNQIAEIIGTLIIHHGINDRPLKEINPLRGELGIKRGKLSITDPDQLKALDTILLTLRNNEVNPQTQ